MSCHLRALINRHDVIAFIHGTRDNPAMPYSASVVDLLERTKAKTRYVDVSEYIRVGAALKRVSGWPLIPQVFIRGEFIGGSDVLSELQRTGDLDVLVRDATGIRD